MQLSSHNYSILDSMKITVRVCFALACVTTATIFTVIVSTLHSHSVYEKSDNSDINVSVESNQLAIETRGKVFSYQMKVNTNSNLTVQNDGILVNQTISIHQRNSISNTVGLSETWKKGSFCDQFLKSTFSLPISVCENGESSKNSWNSSVQCFGTTYSKHMGMCLLENVIINPHLLAKLVMSDGRFDITSSSSEPSIALIGETCPLTTKYIWTKMEKLDYIPNIVEKLKNLHSQHPLQCEQWSKKLAFIFGGTSKHIYFRFLEYFNIHQALYNYMHLLPGGYVIIRATSTKDYNFPHFDKALFSQTSVMALDKLGNKTLCFEKVVLVPRAFSSPAFRCKMEKLPCIRECNGKRLSGTLYNLFRQRVLDACSVSDNAPLKSEPRIVFISRKPYNRFFNDSPRNFKRVLTNEDELVFALRQQFGNSSVTVVHMEELDMCAQVRLAYSADVLIGVHGAGLVHLWWLRDEAFVYELEPPDQVGNPTFRTLATLTGRNYKRLRIQGSQIVSVRVDIVVSDLKEQLSNHY